MLKNKAGLNLKYQFLMEGLLYEHQRRGENTVAKQVYQTTTALAAGKNIKLENQICSFFFILFIIYLKCMYILYFITMQQTAY